MLLGRKSMTIAFTAPTTLCELPMVRQLPCQHETVTFSPFPKSATLNMRTAPTTTIWSHDHQCHVEIEGNGSQVQMVHNSSDVDLFP